MNVPPTKVCHWQVQLNGRTALNGKLYGAQFHGDCEVTEPADVYDAVKVVLDAVAERNREMQLVEACKLTFVFDP